MTYAGYVCIYVCVCIVYRCVWGMYIYDVDVIPALNTLCHIYRVVFTGYLPIIHNIGTLDEDEITSL